jgi:asparagine synthetase B (glutamine-hydrolysing)
MSGARVVGTLDRNFAWDGSKLWDPTTVPTVLRGAAAAVEPANGGWRIVRDPLGINKLFWAGEDDGGIAFAARPSRLIAEGHSLGDIRAVPRGAVHDIPGSAEASLVPHGWSSPTAIAPEAAAEEIRRTLDGYLATLARAHPSAEAYICLSGGLDSSGVAALVREWFPNAVAVSFDLTDAARPSEDRLAAERVAAELGMPLVAADADTAGLLSHLDTVLLEGIDWRDFNVHAALVNAVLAEAIAKAGQGDELVFTGDLPNELLVDYRPERYKGATYYELPRLPPAALRASLVRGLDTCHREVGVFEAFGLPVVQPYAVAVDAYLSLPEDFLGLPDRKERLCRGVFGERLPSFVYARPKARAQTGGGEAGGVLAACIDQGVDAAWLRGRFAELHGVEQPRKLDRFIRAGRYRSAAPSFTGRTGEPA